MKRIKLLLLVCFVCSGMQAQQIDQACLEMAAILILDHYYSHGEEVEFGHVSVESGYDQTYKIKWDEGIDDYSTKELFIEGKFIFDAEKCCNFKFNKLGWHADVKSDQIPSELNCPAIDIQHTLGIGNPPPRRRGDPARAFVNGQSLLPDQDDKRTRINSGELKKIELPEGDQRKGLIINRDSLKKSFMRKKY